MVVPGYWITRYFISGRSLPRLRSPLGNGIAGNFIRGVASLERYIKYSLTEVLLDVAFSHLRLDFQRTNSVKWNPLFFFGWIHIEGRLC